MPDFLPRYSPLPSKHDKQGEWLVGILCLVSQRELRSPKSVTEDYARSSGINI